jgi:DNA repair exonuclease SbcCD ATPase subunit
MGLGTGMPQKANPSQPLVLRVEISADQAHALAPLLEPEAAPAEPTAAAAPSGPTPEMIAERARLAERESELHARARELEERERELEQDEATASEKIRLAHRAKRVADAEGELDDRSSDLEHREAALDAREAEFEADVLLREDRIERWRAELGELEIRLDRKEEELQRYVGELQGAMSRKDPWWPGSDDALIKH